MFNLKYIFIVLPLFGLITAIILFVKKQKPFWLLFFSLFSIIYPYTMEIKKHLNLYFNTNIAEQPQNDLTPLYYAVQMNEFDKVKILLEHGANPNESYTYNDQLIYTAINNNNANITKLLIEHGVNINCINYMNGSPLHLAVSKNDLNLVKLLLENKAFVNIKTQYHDTLRPAGTHYNDFGKTPLHIAVHDKNIKIISLLLEYGADPYIIDNDGKDVLAYTQEKEIIQLIEQKNVKATNK